MGERFVDRSGLCLRSAACAAVVCVAALTASAAGPEPEAYSHPGTTVVAPTGASGYGVEEGVPQSATERRGLGRPEIETQPLRSASGQPRAGVMDGVRTIAVLGGVVTIILGLAVGVRVLAKRHGGLLGACGPGGKAPAGVLSVIGRYPIAKGQTLLLLQLDRRIVLVGQTAGRGGARLTTLSEVAEPEEVASILVKTRDESGESVAKKFREIVDRMSEGASPSERAVTVVPPIARADWFEPKVSNRTSDRGVPAASSRQSPENRTEAGDSSRPSRADGAAALRSRLEAMRIGASR